MEAWAYRSDDNSSFGRVEAERSWQCPLAPKLPDAQDSNVRTRVEVVLANVLVPDVVKGVILQSECWPFSFELEHDETVVVPSSKEVQLRMCC